MVTGQRHLRDWLQLIRAEFEELPGLELTQTQAAELWDLDADVADALLGALVAARVLRRTRQGTYVRDDSATT